MRLIAYDELPDKFKREEILPYYESLAGKRGTLFIKRIFDILASLLLLIFLSPIMLIMALFIYVDSPGPVFYKQKRISQYGKEFNILKFRTMIVGADKQGSQITKWRDRRITSLGKIIRKLHIDELPQFWNVLKGEMTFVGVRPEVPKFVAHYSPEMWATLLMPAGMISRCSIIYKDENDLLAKAKDPEKTYIEEILPAKMKINLQEIKEVSIGKDLKIILDSLLSVFK